MEIRIFNEDDRLKVASILIKNGYRVEQSKRRKIGNNGQPTKSVDYVLLVEDVREMGKE